MGITYDRTRCKLNGLQGERIAKHLRLIVCFVLMACLAASVASEAEVEEVIIHDDSIEVVINSESPDDFEGAIVETTPVEDDWLYNLIESIPDQQGALQGFVQSMALVSGIQQGFAGGIERNELQMMLDKYFDYDESMISEDEDTVTICFSGNVSIKFQYEQENRKFLTQATITLTMEEDIQIANNHMDTTWEYPIIVCF